MAKIVISNAIANIVELKSRLRGVKTPGKRILAAAFKNNDYSALIGELLTRIELYQSVGVLDYKLKDVDTIQGMKFKFGFESVLASTLKASGVSSSPRVVQQIVRQQQVMAPVSLQNVPNNNSNRYLAFMSQAVKAGYISPEILNITKSLSPKERNDMFDIVADGFDAIEKTTLHYTSTGYEQDSDAIFDAIRPISADIKSDLTHYGFDLNQAKQILIGIDRSKGVSSSPRVVQQIVRQQQVIEVGSNVVKLSENAKAYTKIFAKAVKNGDLTAEDADMWNIQSARVKNAIAKRLDNDVDLMIDKKSEYDMNDEGEAEEFWEKMSYISGDFGDDMDNKYHIGSDVASELLFAAFNYASGPSQAALAAATSTILSPNAEYYQDLIETATEVGALDGADADMWHIQPIKVKNSIAILISDALVKLEATGDFETVADDFGYERDIDSYLGFDPGVAILGCIVDATSGVTTGDLDAPITQKVPFNIAGTYGALVEDWCSPGVFEMYKKIQAKVGDSVIQKAAAYIKAKQGKPAGLVGDPMGDSVYNILESAKIKTTYENRELVRQALQTIVANY